MRAKMAARLCVVSVIAGGVAGGVITPIVMRASKRQAEKAARNTARGYVNVRARARNVAEATGKPGELAAISAAVSVRAARGVANRWRDLVAEVENVEKTEQAPSPEPVVTIEDYISSSS